MRPRSRRRTRGAIVAGRLSDATLETMIDEAMVDAHGKSEEASAWFSMLEERLELPFTTAMLGTEVRVTRLDLRDSGEIVAICSRGRERQPISILDLPLPAGRPGGSEWIEAYRYWVARCR